MKVWLTCLASVVALVPSVALQSQSGNGVKQQRTTNTKQEPPKQASLPKDYIHIDGIEFFGYGSLSPAKLRAAVPIRPGQGFSQDAWNAVEPKIHEAISKVTGADLTDLYPVCCDPQGGEVVFIGIAGSSSKPLTFFPAPKGSARLPAYALELENRYNAAGLAADQEGKGLEDDSNGYALFTDPAFRAACMAIREFTLGHSRLVREVLQTSNAAEHRRAAANFLGYDNASPSQVEALLHASRDPDSEVRDLAVRALAVLAGASDKTGVKVPEASFVNMLSSDIWTDRNKGTFVLYNLTQSRDPMLLAELREKAMPALIEMARWEDLSHAIPARILLGLIAGIDESKLFALASRNDQIETIISAAQNTH